MFHGGAAGADTVGDRRAVSSADPGRSMADTSHNMTDTLHRPVSQICGEMQQSNLGDADVRLEGGYCFQDEDYSSSCASNNDVKSGVYTDFAAIYQRESPHLSGNAASISSRSSLTPSTSHTSPPPDLDTLDVGHKSVSPALSSQKKMKYIPKQKTGTNPLCQICSDESSGFHYGVDACEGCKGFFRRCLVHGAEHLKCHAHGVCEINQSSRNSCPACRYRKCIFKGMDKGASRLGRRPKKLKQGAATRNHQPAQIWPAAELVRSQPYSYGPRRSPDYLRGLPTMVPLQYPQPPRPHMQHFAHNFDNNNPELQQGFQRFPPGMPHGDMAGAAMIAMQQTMAMMRDGPAEMVARAAANPTNDRSPIIRHTSDYDSVMASNAAYRLAENPDLIRLSQLSPDDDLAQFVVEFATKTVHDRWMDIVIQVHSDITSLHRLYNSDYLAPRIMEADAALMERQLGYEETEAPSPVAVWGRYLRVMKTIMENIIHFCVSLPGFKELVAEDQVRLIQNSCFVCMLVRYMPLVDTNTLLSFEPTLQDRVSVDFLRQMPAIGEVLSGVVNLATVMGDIQPNDDVYGLISAVCVLGDSLPVLEDKGNIRKLRKLFVHALYYEWEKESDTATALHKMCILIERVLPELSKLDTAHSKTLITLRVNGAERTEMTQFRIENVYSVESENDDTLNLINDVFCSPIQKLKISSDNQSS